jgi:hypothetical protein
MDALEAARNEGGIDGDTDPHRAAIRPDVRRVIAFVFP